MLQSRYIWAARGSFQHITSRRTFSVSIPRYGVDKVVASAEEALRDLEGGKILLVGGFGFSGVPDTLINALCLRSDLKDFTVVSNNAGMPGVGLGESTSHMKCHDTILIYFYYVGQLLESKQISKMIASFIGENKVFEKMYLSGELSLELTPQGTMAEKCAAGASGVPAFYTAAAYGTIGLLNPCQRDFISVLITCSSSNRRVTC